MTADSCGTLVGVQNIACFSAAGNYLLGYFLLVLFFAVVFWRLNGTETTSRMAASVFSTSILAFFLAGLGWINTELWSIAAITTVITAAFLAYRR